MRKYVLTKFHVLQFVYENDNCSEGDVIKFFKKFSKRIQERLQYLESSNLIKCKARRAGIRTYRYYSITPSGEKLIGKNNGNVCGIITGYVRGFLGRFPECEVPTTLDVNWDEESIYQHPIEQTKAGITGMNKKGRRKR